MDGSIAASASLRMRDQLRGVYQAPVDGGDAGLFEELLRMPITESLPKVEADAPAEDDDAPVPAAAPEASHKPDSKPEREDDAVEDVEDEASYDQPVMSVDGVPLVQTIAAPATAAEPLPSNAPQAKEAVPAQSVDHTQAVSSQTAVPNGPSPKAVQATAVVERPTESLETTELATPTTEVLETPRAVQHAVAAPATETVEPTVALEQAPTPAPSLPEGNAEQSNQSPDQSAEVKPAIERQTETPSVSSAVAALSQLQSQAQGQEQGQGQEQSEPQASQRLQEQSQAQAPEQASVAHPAAASETEPARADAGERREKWFLQDDEATPTDQSQAQAASNANENPPLADGQASAANGADAASGLSSTDALDAVGQMTQADAPSAAPEVSAMAAALAQQSGGTSSATPRGDARQTSPGIGQVTGARTPTGAAGQASGATSGERDQGGVASLSQQERVRLVQRVARSFSRLGPDGGQVTLKLHPPQLGVLNMSVRIEGQSMTAKLQTETAAARDAILENLPVLRERLAEQGIDVESFRVEVASERDATANNQPQAHSQNPFSGDSAGGWRGGPRSVDYRRLGRNNSGQDSVAASMRSTDPLRWSAHSPLERSLDIRA